MTSEIEQLEQDRYDAMRQHDVSRLSRMFDEQAVYVHSSTTTEDASAFLENVASGRYRYQSIDITEVISRVVGTTGMVWARMTAEVTIDGVPRALDNKTLAVWSKGDAGWRLVAFQSTVIPSL